MKRSLSLVAATALVIAACSGSSDSSSTEPTPPTSVAQDVDPAAVATEVSPPDGVPDASAAVVRVVTTGTFVSPDFGQLDSVAGSGSAFVIDESGLAVTNNHVVAGAASVEVFFDGADDPIPAVVVGRSECSDLAVIDLAGEGYPKLDWSAEEISVGLEVRAAGYPGGDPGLTLTGGIVARVDNDGATPWASIPSLLRHDAELAPGNSGGPIVDATGAVVGVNVAASDSGRYAIPASVAQPIVDDLRAGIDVDSIGLNAVAVLDKITNESGVWVVSVEPGSPAAMAGLQPGDVITRMKGVRVGRDATLADYCAVVRSTGDGELPIEVSRGDGFLAGSLRGTGLVPVLSVTDDVVATASEPPPMVTAAPPPGTSYEAFETVTDDSGTISFDVPTAWIDRRTGPVFFAGAERPAIAAAVDVDALDVAAGTSYDQAGVAAIVFSADVEIEDAFSTVMGNSPWMFDCIPLEREVFDDALYGGVFQAFMDCAGTPSTVFSIALQRVGEPNWLLINIFAPTVADLDAGVTIASTYEFGGSGIGAPANDAGADDVEAPGAETDDATVELPKSLSTMDDLVATIGLPPMAGEATTSGRNTGIVTLTYPTAATADEVRAWIDERILALRCESPLVTETSDDIYWFYSVTCDFEPETTALSYTVRVYGFDDDLEVDVSAIDWNAE